jgi:hypothetical protein
MNREMHLYTQFIPALAVLACSLRSTLAASSTATGSFSICQFFSSYLGATETSVSSMTLPPCPSSDITYSYTIPTATSTLTAPDSTTTSALLCQFFSSYPGATETSVSSMTLPPCPSSVLDITYSYLATTTLSSGGHPTATIDAGALTSLQTTLSPLPTFTGLAPPPVGAGKAVVGGAGLMAAAMVLL